MPGPTPNFDVVQVHGTYVGADGTLPQGTVIFRVDTSRLVDASAVTTIVPYPIVAPLINGEFTIDVPTTDDPDITPTGFTYEVIEDFVGGQIYHIDVPISAVGTGLDIADVVPADISTGIGTTMTRSEFDSLLATMTQVRVVPVGTGDPSAEADGTLWIEYNP